MLSLLFFIVLFNSILMREAGAVCLLAFYQQICQCKIIILYESKPHDIFSINYIII